MPFEIDNVRWSPIEITEEELRPIFSPVTDSELENITLGEVGLIGKAFSSVDQSRTLGFNGGRLVVANSLRPEVFGEQNMPDPVRWFEAGGHVVRLLRQYGTSCYSDRRLQAAASIFGPRG